METQSAILGSKMALVPVSHHSSVSLHDLVKRIANSLSPAAWRNKSYIINDVPVTIHASVNENILASVVSKLMNVIIMNTANSCIRITAESHGNKVLLHVNNDACLNYNSISHQLTRIQSLAERMGGFVGFTSYRNKLTTIDLSYTNFPSV